VLQEAFLLTVKLASHHEAPGSSCVATLPDAKLLVSAGKPALVRPPVLGTGAASGAMAGHWLFGALTTPRGPMEEAKAGQDCGVDALPGLMS
jgi:hypothetical protein